MLDSLRLSDLFLENFVLLRILDFRRWVIFELLIDVVFGCWEYRMKKGNERKGK